MDQPSLVQLIKHMKKMNMYVNIIRRKEGQDVTQEAIMIIKLSRMIEDLMKYKGLK